MDDEDDGQDSRAPTIEDLARVCDSLNRSEAQYALIGGFAVIAHGTGRTTKDDSTYPKLLNSPTGRFLPTYPRPGLPSPVPKYMNLCSPHMGLRPREGRRASPYMVKP